LSIFFGLTHQSAIFLETESHPPMYLSHGWLLGVMHPL